MTTTLQQWSVFFAFILRAAAVKTKLGATPTASNQFYSLVHELLATQPLMPIRQIARRWSPGAVFTSKSKHAAIDALCVAWIRSPAWSVGAQ